MRHAVRNGSGTLEWLYARLNELLDTIHTLGGPPFVFCTRTPMDKITGTLFTRIVSARRRAGVAIILVCIPRVGFFKSCCEPMSRKSVPALKKMGHPCRGRRVVCPYSALLQDSLNCTGGHRPRLRVSSPMVLVLYGSYELSTWLFRNLQWHSATNERQVLLASGQLPAVVCSHYGS